MPVLTKKVILSIHPEVYRSKIEGLLREIGLDQCALVVADSVQDWATGVGMRQENPFRAGMAVVHGDGLQLIVLLSDITADIQTSIINAMEMRGFWEEVSRLNEPAAFLEHLILHEAAHLLLDGASESECDMWAFDHLGKGSASLIDSGSS